MTDDLPTPEIERPSTGRIGPAILVWLVPLAALVVAGFVTFRTVNDRGPLVTISFAEASGVTADETGVRFRDVTVGVVEKVSFSAGLDRVLVTVRLDKDVAAFADDDAEFWIVQPEVTTRGITGLNTVLSGVYIEANWDNQQEGLITSFLGLDRAPLSVRDRDGLSFTLTSRREGGLQPNTPILYKGIEVGRVGAPRITADGTGVEADAYVEAPHHLLITTATRFWDTSGVRFTLGPNGAEIDFDSIASLLSGGISFQTIVSGGTPPANGATFEVFPDEGTARSSVFEPAAGQSLTFAMIFDQNVSGLETQAPVELGGIRVGEVTTLTGLVDEARFGDSTVRLVAVVEVNVGPLGLPEGSTRQDAFDLLQRKVQQEELRARLTNASLLTGGLKVEMVRVPGAAPAEITEGEPFALFPTAAAAIDDVTASAEDVLRRIDDLPIEQLFESAIAVLDNAAALLRNEDLNGTPAALRAILADVGALTGSEAVQALPRDVAAVSAAVQATAVEAEAALADLATLMAGVTEADLTGRALGALEAATDVAGQIGTAAEGLPPLIAEVQTLAEAAQTIPFADLSAEVETVLAAAATLLGDDALAALPQDAAAALQEAQDLAAALRSLVASDALQGLAPDAQSLLAALQDAVTDLRGVLGTADTTARDLSTAVAEMPALLSEFQALAAEARQIPFAEVSQRLDALLARADTLLSGEALAALPSDIAATLEAAQALAADLRGLVASEGVQALPGEAAALVADMQAAVTDLRGTLADLRDQGAVDRLVAAVDATTEAAQGVTTSVAGLPDLIAELQAVAGQAGDLPLTALTQSLTETLDAAEALLTQPGTRDLPETLGQAIGNLDALVVQIRQGGAIDNVNAALAAAEGAAAAVETATASLPALIQSANAVLAQANQTLASLDGTSELSREARSALREVSRAAAAVSSLARSLERRPNSILLGR